MLPAEIENAIVANHDATTLALHRIVRHDVGGLPLPSGRLVACDPLLHADRAPLARRLAPGTYPLQLYAHGAIGVAVLRLAPGPIVRFEVEAHAITVDGGLVGLFDASLQPAWLAAERAAAVAGGNYYDAVLDGVLEAAGHVRGFRCAAHVPAGACVHAWLFDAGWGDGVYDAGWGFDAEGRACAFVIDFGVFERGDARGGAERATDAARDALTPAQREAMLAAHAALLADDLEALRVLLATGVAHPERYVPGVGATLTFEAIRHDRAAALALLRAHGAAPTMPDWLQLPTMRRYDDYARCLQAPRSPQLLREVAALDAAASR